MVVGIHETKRWRVSPLDWIGNALTSATRERVLVLVLVSALVAVCGFSRACERAIREGERERLEAQGSWTRQSQTDSTDGSGDCDCDCDCD